MVKVTLSSLEAEIKSLIIRSLDLEDIGPEEIDSSEMLFGDGLGLDSIDALELGVAIEEQFAVSIDSKDENISNYFASVKNLAEYVASMKGIDVL